MMNQIVMIGRLTSQPKIKELENGTKNCIITLAVPRSYKNEDGCYDTDFIDVILYSNIAENTTNYCRQGDLVGIKGRIQTRIIENEEKEKKKITEIIADKVTFLSSNTQNTNN